METSGLDPENKGYCKDIDDVQSQNPGHGALRINNLITMASLRHSGCDRKTEQLKSWRRPYLG